jgi:hydrogenase expression/formation protein HypE
MEKNILLGHGSGGRLSHELISEIFYKHFGNPILGQQSDSAVIPCEGEFLSFTTDSYVVTPVFFNGGNIGKLAVCGTVNDLAVSGAIPKYISSAFIIEEGLSADELETIVATMAEEARKAGVIIATGDTKVVNKGQCDKIFINTTGIGFLKAEHKSIGTGELLRPGDKILINGSIADHGMTIMAERNFTNFDADIKSDCAPLNHMIKAILDANCKIKFMRDATRGGIATVLCEIAEQNNLGVLINEDAVLVKDNVRGLCELLGFDPFYVANEGKVIIIVDSNDAEKAIEIMRRNEFGKESSIIGEITNEHPSKAFLKTIIGGTRIIDMLAGEQLPRIC